ncbi:Sec7 domain containing protein [Aphelenchoides avenae]|nr:Sec7 domain containing protein [Aphelenchus avenae]
MTNKLARLREDAPSMKSKGKPVYEYFYRERYLDKERERYELYVSILSDKLATLSQNGTIFPSDRCSVGTASLSKNYSTRVNRQHLNVTLQSVDSVPNGHSNSVSSGELASNRHVAGKRSVDDITEYDEATEATQAAASSSRHNSPKKCSRQQ